MPSPPSSPPLQPARPLIRRASRRSRVRGLLRFEWPRIPELLELIAPQVDGRRIERHPDSPGLADLYAVRPADPHAIGQGGRPLQAGDAGFHVVRPNTVVQRFSCILPDRRDFVLGGLPFQVGRGWRTGGRRTGIVRSPYLPGQQHLLVVNVAMEGHQPNVDGPVRQLGAVVQHLGSARESGRSAGVRGDTPAVAGARWTKRGSAPFFRILPTCCAGRSASTTHSIAIPQQVRPERVGFPGAHRGPHTTDDGPSLPDESLHDRCVIPT